MAKKKVSFDIEIPSVRAEARKKVFSDSEHKKSSKKSSKHKKPKKAIPSAYREAYGAYKRKLLTLVSGFLEQEFGVIVEWIKDILNVKKKVRAFSFYMAFLISGIVLILSGIAMYLDCICVSYFGCGLNFMLVGALALIFAILYKKIFI